MEKKFNYTLGFYIDTSYVGWSVLNLDKNRIEDLGVRTFAAAEDPQTGASLAVPRRLSRSTRKLLRRKSYRVRRVRKMILEKGILSQDELKTLFDNINENVWELRVKGLDEKLDNKQWARLLINFAKRRGYKSTGKSEDAADDKEAGKLLNSIKENKINMAEMETRTIGEYLYNKKVNNSDDRFKPFRNKAGAYDNCIARSDLRQEIITLFQCQRGYGNEFANKEIQDKYLEIFDSQRPFSDFTALEKLVGFCTLEKGEKRAPKNCISFEEFVLYQTMNNTTLVDNGYRRNFTEEERGIIADAAFNKKELKYSNVRKLLKLSDDTKFSALSYEDDKAENQRFIAMSGYYEIKKAIEKSLGKEYFEKIKDNKKLLNDIAYVLSLAKTDEEVFEQMSIRNIPEEIAESVKDITFYKFANLSIKAIDKILPFLKQGYIYNKACEKAGYDFQAKDRNKAEKSYKLPVIDIEEIVSPVVNRSLTQTRKIINSVIAQYECSPVNINIQLASGLSKTLKDRKSMEKKRKDNKKASDKIKEELAGLMGTEPTSAETVKYKLWLQQKGVCPYSQEEILFDDLFKPGYCEVDHIIPFSRSFDNSFNNKILVKSVENQRKGTKTPYEYLSNNEEKWTAFDTWVNESELPFIKKNKLLKRDFSFEDEWALKQKSLYYTNFIGNNLARFIDSHLLFNNDNSKSNVHIINPGASSYLKFRWGLYNEQRGSDKYYALNACITAAVTDKLFSRISKYSKAHELYNYNADENGEIFDAKEYLKKVPKFPEPWSGFAGEVKIRVSDKPMEELEKFPLKAYDKAFVIEHVKPIFISIAPVRKISGQLFKETIYSAKAFTEDGFVTKKKLQDLTEKDFNNIYNYGTDKRLYEALYNRFLEFNKDAKKAFEEEFRKPTKNGNLGPVVRSIKVVSSVPFKKENAVKSKNGGLLNRSGMARIDIYCKDDKYYAVPVYKYQILKNEIPKKAAVAGKTEEDWIVMDSSYTFKFSLYKNDLIKIKFSNGTEYFAYYNSFNRASCAIEIRMDDSSKGKKSLGIKMRVICFEKYEMDVLGNYHKIKKEHLK